MKKINANYLKGNIYGGITAGVIALPLALAFGVASGMGAAAGLYGAIFVCLFASLFGGTKTQISGPTGPMTVVVASVIALYPNNPKIICMTICLAGIFQIILGLIKVGDLIKYVPYPVISGFMSGVGAIIVLLQINPLFGHDAYGNVLQTVKSYFHILQNVNPQCLILGILTLLIVYFTPKKIGKIIPSSLLALIMATVVAVVCKFNVPVIGEIPTGLPHFQLGLISIKEFYAIVPVALTLAVLGSIDSLLTSLVADSMTRTKHNSNKELIGQGLGNAVAGMFGGIAGAGATMRTAVNIKSGGTDRLSGVVHCILLAVILIFLAPVASKIPLCVLSAILIKVGFDIIDYKFLSIAKSVPRKEFAVMGIVFFLTVFYDLIFAVAVGIVLASILFAASVSASTKISSVKIDEMDDVNDDIFDDERYKKLISFIRIDGAFFFGSSACVLNQIEKNSQGVKCVVLYCKRVVTIDVSAIFVLEEIIERFESHGVKVILVMKDWQMVDKILHAGLAKILTADNFAFSKETALIKAKRMVRHYLK